MRLKHIFGLLCITLLQLQLSAQEEFYNSSLVREIKVSFPYSDWQQKLDSLFVYQGDEGRLTCDVTIDGHFYKNAGIRYKGYSSYNSNEVKNPFNIDLDYKISNQNHLGHSKLKLSNVIHDPSFVREVLAYEIARKYFPASQANFANLYINDSLIGLYTNVEAVDKRFVKKRYGSDQRPFFKGEPAKLEYPFGQNANLALTHGTDSLNYALYYKMESDAGLSDLYQFIEKLDSNDGTLSDWLNIDRALWMHAFNEVIVNLDSYIGYSQNFYLYQDDNHRFNPIVWDLNMSFGSFRDSDGSYHFRGLTIDQCKKLDPLETLSFCVSPRPLMTKLLADESLRKIYFAHMRTILKENLTNGWYYQRGAALQNLINADVYNDKNKFYTYSDFLQNIDTTVGGVGDMILYPGLKELMSARQSFLDSLRGMNGEPVITVVSNEPFIPVIGEPLWLTAIVTDAKMVQLNYRYASGAVFQKTTMFDDGTHGDGAAGDHLFGAQIVPSGNTIQYYFFAENDTAASFSPERAEYEFYTLQPKIEKGDIVINEVKAMVSNLPDNGGWVEFYNNTNEAYNLGGARLKYGAEEFVLPDTLIEAKGYIVLQNVYGPYDPALLPYAISQSGGNLTFYNVSGEIVDSVNYTQQVAGKSVGRYPNGYGKMTFMLPSYKACNFIGTTPTAGILLYPNPATDQTNIEIENATYPLSIVLFNTFGNEIKQFNYTYKQATTPSVIQPIDLTGLQSGLYFIKVTCNDETVTKKLIIF